MEIYFAQKKRSYSLDGTAIIPIPHCEYLYYNISDVGTSLLMDFYNLLESMDQERKLAQKMGWLSSYKTSSEPRLIYDFICKYGLFGIYADRQGKDYYGSVGHSYRDPFYKHQALGKNVYRENLLDLLSKEKIESAGDYRLLFPNKSNTGIPGMVIKDDPTGEDLNYFDDEVIGESTELITNHFRFAKIQKDYLISLQNRTNTINTNSENKLYYQVFDIAGIVYHEGKTKIIVNSLIEAIEIMHLLNKTNREIRNCKHCGKLFEVESQSRTEYCPDPDKKCKNAHNRLLNYYRNKERQTK